MDRRTALVMVLAAGLLAFAASATCLTATWENLSEDGVILICPAGDGDSYLSISGAGPGKELMVQHQSEDVLLDDFCESVGSVFADQYGNCDYYPAVGWIIDDPEDADCIQLTTDVQEVRYTGNEPWYDDPRPARTFDLSGDCWANGRPEEEGIPSWGDYAVFEHHYLEQSCRCDFTGDVSGNYVNLMDYAVFATHLTHPGLWIEPTTYSSEVFTGDTHTWDLEFLNYGMAPVDFQIEEDPPTERIDVTPSAGTILIPDAPPPDPVNDTAIIGCTVTGVDTMQQSSYYCYLRLVSNSAYYPRMKLSVFLQILRRGEAIVTCEVVGLTLPPRLGIETDPITLEPELGGSDCDTLVMRNWGEEVLKWSITDTCLWTSPVPASGTLEPEESVAVEFCTEDIGGLEPSVEYTCEFAVVSNDTVNPSIPVQATLFIEPGSGVNDLPRTRLAQNHPNPFNPKTSIAFTVAESGPVSLRVYNLAGRVVRTLVDELRMPNEYEVRWDGRDDSGNQVGSGVYYYSLEIAGERETKRMVLLK